MSTDSSIRDRAWSEVRVREGVEPRSSSEAISNPTIHQLIQAQARLHHHSPSDYPIPDIAAAHHPESFERRIVS
jgi:hypothetical protein